MAQALEQRYGMRYQDEVFRSRFQTHNRRRDESPQELAYNPEGMVYKAYPEVNNGLITVLLHDKFIDALDSSQLKIQVK
ncbi:hypothetical protein E2C01_054723 [Portunus trituberculatus]|uniref:Uncharacterized protein n=1 Tax=Portunus trituberculatus TaxID=210409 RepID=A0A5B7GU21_PORTR|nr:hypothetical protein [Portunus trituberculatus]